ncbi:MAG: DMT family transporter [Desulfobulbaceae bacterium]|nr:DMT family transporter [Desulfobulbaceae bacterium]
MALVLMLLSSASFATMSAMVKALGTSMPLSQLIFFRCILPLPFFLGLILYQRKSVIVKAKGTVLLRSFFGFLAMSGFYYALTHMPFANCIFIGRAQPLLLALLAPFVVGEKVPRIAWLAIALGMAGVMVIMRPSASVAVSFPALVAFVAAGSAACAHLMIRRLNRTDDPIVIVFNFFLLTAFFSGWCFGWHFIIPTAGQWLFITGIALFATLGQFLMTIAYRLDKAPVVAAASYSSIVLSVIYGYLFWDEIPTAPVFAGAFLVLSGGYFLFISRFRPLK